jgi:CRISPR-associated protein Cas2
MPHNLATSGTYVVSYDIADPARLRQVFKTMKGWGLHIQYSVFQCDLTPKALTELQSELEDLIDHNADQVLFIHVGPSKGRAKSAIKAMGKPYAYPVREALIF